jgi:hypothetical protein
MKYQAAHANLDTQLGERRDYTTIIHSIGCLDMDDSTGPQSWTTQTENRAKATLQNYLRACGHLSRGI